MSIWLDAAEVVSQIAFVVFVVGALGILAYLLIGFGGHDR